MNVSQLLDKEGWHSTENCQAKKYLEHPVYPIHVEVGLTHKTKCYDKIARLHAIADFLQGG